LREHESVPRRLGVWNENVQLDIVGCAHARRCGQVHTRVADRGCDAGERSGLVLELDDEVEGNRTIFAFPSNG